MNLLKRSRYLPAMIMTVLAFISCDDDFNSIGGELIGGEQQGLPQYEAGVIAYNNPIGPVQTNNLTAHLLGVYNAPVYGQRSANVLTQLSMPSGGINPNFGNEPRLDSVVLILPYFSTSLAGNEEEEGARYRLDSIYGNSPFKLTISRSGYFLNDLDPDTNFENRQRYFSNQGQEFENNLVGEPIYVNESFIPSPREVSVRQLNATGVFDTIAQSPRMRIHLPVDYFRENIIDRQGSNVLFNNNNFRNFFRGLYFQAEPVNGDGSMMMLNFTSAEAGVVLYYSNTPVNEGDDEDDEESEENGEGDILFGSYRLRFGDNIVNTYSQNMPAQIEQQIAASNSPPGATNLYLNGGEGSMAIIQLFEDEEELADLRSRNWLINEANLTFYVNQEIVPGGNSEPSRLYLYNLDSNELLVDYRFDTTVQANDPRNAAVIHAPPLVRGEDGNGIYYRIRITEHVRRILSQDINPVRLGLVVIQNIQSVNNALIRNPQIEGINRVPAGAVNAPKGTVLHGNLSPDAEKRLKFTIFYTGTNN